jgi:hypothetical protein
MRCDTVSSRGRNRGGGLNNLNRSLSSCKISQSLRFFEMTTRTSQVSFRPKGEIFLSSMAQITLRRIHDLPKVLQIILQLRAELGADDKVRLELKLSELTAQPFIALPFPNVVAKKDWASSESTHSAKSKAA